MLKYQHATIFALLFFCVSSMSAGASFEGDWVGGFERQGSLVIVQTHFRTAENGTTGTIDVIDLSMNMPLMGKALDKLELSLSRVHFESVNKAGRLSFEAQVTNGVMTGMVEERGEKLPFRLDLIAEIDPAQFVGVYEIGVGH